MSLEHNPGVVYSPSTVSNTSSLDVEMLEELGISYIRFQWVDLVNNVRFRIIPVGYFKQILKSPRPGIAVARITMAFIEHLIATNVGSLIGEYIYVPDLSSLRVCPYSPGEAVIMGWFQETNVSLSAKNQLCLDASLCPRAALRRVVQLALDHDIQFLVGFELEFVLLKSIDPIEPSNRRRRTLPSSSIDAKVLREIADGIRASGIELQLYHPEGAPGQYEMVTGPLAPLPAADALVHTREIIYNTALKHNLHATFAPKVFKNAAGSSIHAHISVHSQKIPKTAESLSSFEASFLSSILSHLPALTALTLPIPASYDRLVDGFGAGGTYVNWGTDNREAPIRLTKPTSPSSRRFEIRFVDGTANPYLALAGILGTGLAGIRDNVTLNIRDCSGSKTAAQMTEVERRELGITERMPLSWEESRRNFSRDSLLGNEILGDELARAYLAANQTLEAALNVDGDDNAAKLTRLVEAF